MHMMLDACKQKQQGKNKHKFDAFKYYYKQHTNIKTFHLCSISVST